MFGGGHINSSCPFSDTLNPYSRIQQDVLYRVSSLYLHTWDQPLCRLFKITPIFLAENFINKNLSYFAQIERLTSNPKLIRIG